MKKKKINRRSSSLFAIMFCLMLGFLFNNTGTAQTPFNPFVTCVNGCTAKDIKNISAALVQPTSPYNVFPPSFSCNSGDNVSVKLAVYLTTSTQKAGIYVYANIRRTADNVILGTVSECFSTGALTTVGDVTRVVFTPILTWTCGVGIKLTDVFVGWGTGNSDFCQGSTDPRCPATNSKCYSLSGDAYVPVVIPGGVGASQTKCSTNPGGTTATFDLTESDATVKNGQTGVHVRWYSDAAGTTELTGTGKTALNTGTTTVYAKVCNDPAPGAVCSGLQSVTLTVITTPTATSTSDSKCSTTGGGTTATFDLTSYESTVKGSQTGVTVSWFSNSGLTTSIGSPASFNTTTTTVYAKVAKDNTTCFSSASVVLTVNSRPANPVASVTQPTCASSNGSVVITSPTGTDYAYSNNGGSWQASPSFTVAANAAYSISVRNVTSLCASTGVAAGTMGSQPAGPSTPAVCVVQPSLCGPALGKVKFTDLGAGYQYSINGTDWQTCNVFVGVAAGAATSLKVKNSFGCESSAANCNTICAGDPDAIVACQVQGRVSQTSLTQQTEAKPELGVKAYPNPFSDRVKFMVTSGVAGNGNLEIYNMLGQKVKTVYQGYIAAGTQIFELSLPNKQVANMVYVLRIGDKKITGKILQVNQ